MSIFPKIEHIDDLLPHLDDEHFYVAKKDGYTIVNYVNNSSEVFPSGDDLRSRMRREARGIAFYPDGKIMSRPFHKFFNLGEREDFMPEHLPLLASSTPLEKLDGSMIRPLFLSGIIALATKNGVTDVSKQAESWMRSDVGRYKKYLAFIIHGQNAGLTPIFEWCSRFNKIVIDYPEPSLILTAIRDIKSGTYLGYNDLVRIAKHFDIPYVTAYAVTFEDAQKLARLSTKDEGIVAVMANGEMVKVKSDWYIQLHRAKEAITRERDVVELLLAEKLDDLFPLLSPEDKVKLDAYITVFLRHLHLTARDVELAYTFATQIGRKDFALRYMGRESSARNRALAGIVFKVMDDPSKAEKFVETVKEAVLRLPAKKNEFTERVRTLLGFEHTWNIGDYS